VSYDLLGIAITVLFIPLLTFAAIEDIRRKEVPNRVWVLSLGLMPLTLLRLLSAGLHLVYVIQTLLTFVLVMLAFQAGLIGGADGKAIMMLALLYPLPEIEEGLLMVSPFLVLLGAFMIMGLQCTSVVMLNIHEWISDRSLQEHCAPDKIRYWFTRRLHCTLEGEAEWKQVSVPLVLYILVAYFALLCVVIF